MAAPVMNEEFARFMATIVLEFSGANMSMSEFEKRFSAFIKKRILN